MKIALVLDSYVPARGGVEQWTARYAAWLTRNGHRVWVVAERFCPQAVRDTRIVPVELPRTSDRLARAEQAGHLAQQLRVDVVHDMGLGYRCDVLQPHGGSWLAGQQRNLALLPAWQRRWKATIAPWLPRYRAFRKLIDRQYAPGGPMVLALSRMVAADLRRLHNLPDARMRLIYNGVDVLTFTPDARTRHREPVRASLNLSPEAVLLLIVAHNFRLKGVPTLIRACSELAGRGHDVHVAVAGGKRLAAWQRYAASWSVADRVHFVGSVADPVPWYAAADVYVQPTYYDPCSLVVLEALACGLPTVTSQFNGAGELITPGREGEIVQDPGDHFELAAALEPYFDDKLRGTAGQAARRLALEHTFDHNARRILGLYHDLTHPRSRAA